MKPTKIELSEALKTYFNCKYGYADLPVTCKCGFTAESISGVSIHLKKNHDLYVKRPVHKVQRVHRKQREGYGFVDEEKTYTRESIVHLDQSIYEQT